MHTLLPYLAAISVLAAPSSASPLTVDEAVRLARQSSPHLAAARYQAQASQAQTDREKPVARPVVTAQAISTLQGPRATFPRAGDGDATVLPESYSRLEISVEQPLYRAGLGAARNRYCAQSQATAWELSGNDNDTVLEVRRACYNLYLAEAMTQVAKDGVDLARKHLDLTRLMLQSGNASERDTLAAEADLADAEQGALKATNGVALARANLNMVLGRLPGTAVELTPLPDIPAAPDSPEAGISQALAHRPELLALRAGVTAATAGASLAATQDSPALALRGSAAQQTPSAFVRQTYASASLVLTWTPFDAGKSRADRQEATAQAAKLNAQLQEAALGIRVEVEKAWRDMLEAKGRIDAADRQIASAAKAHQISELRYQQRMATQLEVSGALLAYTKACANKQQAVNDCWLANAQYAHATGADVIPVKPNRPTTVKPQ